MCRKGSKISYNGKDNNNISQYLPSKFQWSNPQAQKSTTTPNSSLPSIKQPNNAKHVLNILNIPLSLINICF